MLWAFVVAVAAIDVVVVLQASVPAVEGFGQGSAFHLNVRPGAAETGGHEATEGRERAQDELHLLNHQSHLCYIQSLCAVLNDYGHCDINRERFSHLVYTVMSIHLTD